MSHPVRVRGLKHVNILKLNIVTLVAPRAGAWIETCVPRGCCRGSQRVAPRAGAWIETCTASPSSSPGCVAPRAGAWIETCLCRISNDAWIVAPRAGAWIETWKQQSLLSVH